MRTSIITSTILLFYVLKSDASTGDRTKALEIQNEMRRQLGSYSDYSQTKPKPKPHPSNSGSGGTGSSGSSSGGGSSGGGSSGGGSSGGGSSGGGSSGGGSSGGGSSGGGSSGTSSLSAQTSSVVAPKKMSTGTKFLSVAAAGVAIVVAALFHRRRVAVTNEPHPLEGSIARRVMKFEKFVKPQVHSSPDYNAMSDQSSVEMV